MASASSNSVAQAGGACTPSLMSRCRADVNVAHRAWRRRHAGLRRAGDWRHLAPWRSGI